MVSITKQKELSVNRVFSQGYTRTPGSGGTLLVDRAELLGTGIEGFPNLRNYRVRVSEAAHLTERVGYE